LNNLDESMHQSFNQKTPSIFSVCSIINDSLVLCTWAEDPEDTYFKIIRFVHGLQLWENTPLLQIAPLHMLLNSFIEIACILLSRNNEELHRGITIFESFWGSKAENPMGRRRRRKRRRNPNW
jgi:hypothetical protein